MGRLSKSYQDALAQAQAHSTEALGAMRTVQSYAAEEREGLRYRRLIGEPDSFPWWWPTTPKMDEDKINCTTAPTTTYRAGVLNSIAESGFYGFIYGVGFGAMCASLWYGFDLVNDGIITFGQLTAFQSYIYTIGDGLGSSSQYMSIFIQGQGAAGRILYLLNRIPSIPTSFHE
jgi:ABC-type multidrug transport system fused ATPase/permease subunit